MRKTHKAGRSQESVMKKKQKSRDATGISHGEKAKSREVT